MERIYSESDEIYIRGFSGVKWYDPGPGCSLATRPTPEQWREAEKLMGCKLGFMRWHAENIAVFVKSATR